MTRIVTVIGARPQFIKAAPVSSALRQEGIRETLVHTGQHYDPEMSDVFFRELAIPAPAYHLGIGGGSHGQMTGRQLEAIEKVLVAERPDLVLVYGDTNSTLAGTLAAVKLHIPVAHVEAGLRSHNRRMPEEINRVLTDHAAAILFAPTGVAVTNLRNEGIPPDRVHLVGDVMLDASLHFRSLARAPDWFEELGLDDADFVLCTIHRAENTDDPAPLRKIMEGLAACGEPTVLPLHPRTRHSMAAAGIALPRNVLVRPPVGYLEILWLQMRCAVIVTDSGGMQKEAFFHGKPCVTLREETEWTELVEAGANVLVGTDPQAIARAIAGRRGVSSVVPLYGQGDAARKISAAVCAR